MKLAKLIKAFRNTEQILEGIKNKIFKQEHIEAIAKLRWQQCRLCDKLDMKGSECVAPGTQPCCADCGCSLGLKLRALSSECPLDKWGSLMEEEIEEKLKKSINGKQKKKDNCDFDKG